MTGYHALDHGFAAPKVSGLQVAQVPFLTIKTKTRPVYTLAWLARGLMKSWMWRNGLHKLRKVDDTSLRSFSTAFPDQKDMFTSMVGSHVSWEQTLSQFFQAINFRGPWELCTMVWCFCGNPIFDRVHVGDLQKAVRPLKARRVEQKPQIGQNPTPAMLVAKHFQIRSKDVAGP